MRQRALPTKFAVFVAIIVSFIGLETCADGPPDPPDGFRWVPDEAFSDEFDGSALDESKWHDHNPRWKGRPPGKFMPSNVTVSDGFLQIRSTILDPPDGEFTVACGAIQSKSHEALYGYYECRVKASSISTSTTFWLTGGPKRLKHGKANMELDILECIGGARKYASFKSQMKSNTHYNFFPDDSFTDGKTPDPQRFKAGGSADLNSNVDAEFHTYGCWWVDANHMKFYADGEYAFTITPSTEIDPTPFDHPLFMNIVCETYSWEVPPTIEQLNDRERNTAYYDWVRSYQLVREDTKQ